MCALQVSTCLNILYIYFTDIGKMYRAHPGPLRADFDPSHQGGQNRKNRDSVRTRRAVVSPFWALILVPIGMGFTPLQRRRISCSHLGRCGRFGAKIFNCDSTRQISILLLHPPILLIYTSRLLCFLPLQVRVRFLYAQIKILG